MRPAELISRRRSLEMTQAELAEKLEVSPNTVARWERGERAIPPLLKWALLAVEQADASLSYEERYERNQEIIERHHREAEEREAAATPEEREAAERWFGTH